MKPSTISALVLGIIAFFSSQVAAEYPVHITPFVGYTFSGDVTDENGINIQPENDLHFALSVETDVDPGRVGLFISYLPTETQDFKNDTSFTYLHFQSSLRFELIPKIDTYFGASLGGTFVDADWSDNSLLFSAGLFGGVEYKLHKNAKIVFETRWLANFVDSNTSSICTLPTGDETCKIHVDSKLLSQFQTNLGLRSTF
ncbi:hypothetical protein L4D77_16770 [Photobacterium frigidiphilum]|uniref:hypothetical protein n=1 Tax=Photobacterium frigidiphilum TaxID=264736 RepID=UPI003D0D5351